MPRTLVRTVRRASLPLLGLVAAGALVSAAPASAAPAHKAASARVAGQLYIFSGTLAAAPAGEPDLAPAAGLRRQPPGAPRPRRQHRSTALVRGRCEDLVHRVDGQPAGERPTATTAATLKAGDPVHLRIRAHRGSPLSRLMAKPGAHRERLRRRTARHRAHVHVLGSRGRDRSDGEDDHDRRPSRQLARAERHARPARARDVPLRRGTQFLSWIRRTPHTFLRPRSRSAIRSRCARARSFRTPLANLLAAPLWKVNDHEPSSVITSSGGNLEVGN